MPGRFGNLKVRYILIDYFFISTILAVLVMLISLAVGISIVEEIIQPFSIAGNMAYIFLFCSICGLIAYRLKFDGTELQRLVGNLKFGNISWILLLIIFYGEQNLVSGVNHLEYYLANLVSPELLQSSIKTYTESSQQIAGNFLVQIIHYLLLLFVLVIVAPITEEFIFRGVILHRWAAKWGAFWSIILSSLFFGAIHGDIFWFGRAVGSLFFALYYIQTGVLIVPIILHAMNNGLVFISMIIDQFNPTAVDEMNIDLEYLWHGVLNILLAIPVLVYFLKFPKKIEEFPYFTNQAKVIDGK